MTKRLLIALLGLAVALAPLPASPQLATKGGFKTKGSSKTKTSIPPCPDTNFATLLAMPRCWQKTAVMTWLTYTCTDDAGELCPGLGANGSNFSFALDHGGCLPLYSCPVTLFMGRGSLPNSPGLTAGQTLHITITGTVYGSGHFNPWPHYKQVNNNQPYVGQAGNGIVEWKFTISCGAGCISPPGPTAVSDLVCNSTTHSGPECNEQTTEAAYSAYNIVSTPASSSAPYNFICELIMTAGTGTAFTVSNGMHFAP